MTSVVIRRCEHCGNRYTYQQSGGGASELNHGAWCEDCYSVVREALSTRVRQFQRRYRPVEETDIKVTYEQLIECEQEKARRNKGASFFDRELTQIFPGMYDMTTGEMENVRLIVGPDRRRYMVGDWPKRKDYTIKVQWEWDLVNKCWTDKEWI